MKITREEALEIVDDNGYMDHQLTDAEAGGNATYTVVFKRDDGKFYQFDDVDDGGVGDEYRFPDEVECVEVEAYQETVTRYRPIVKEKTA